MKFGKIYIEITNICNLKCSFCPTRKSKKEEMSIEKFEHILKEIKSYTKTIYLHVQGEPLLHSNLDSILALTKKYDFKVKITTNGTLITEKIHILKKYDNIKQINISLHSEHKKDNYFEEVFSSCDELSKKINIVYRIWMLKNFTLDKLSTLIVDKIIKYYKLDNNFKKVVSSNKNIKIKDNVYLDKDNEFIWPNDVSKNNNENGTCLGGRNQLAILVNGDVVPCCLDYKANLKFGNIFHENFKDILKNPRLIKMQIAFQNKKVIENLCRNCNYRIQKFDN